MKKIYAHELNEAKAAKATAKCFIKRQRLTEGNIAEVYPETRWKEGQERLAGPNGMSKTERSLLIKLEEQIPALVEKAMLKVQDHEDPQSIKKLILDMIVKKFVSKMAEKVGSSWKEFSMGFKKELKNMVIDSINQHNSSKEEQEEIGATGQPQEMEEDGVNKNGMHNLVQVDRIMNTTAKYESDEEERYNQAFRVIAELIADQLDREFPDDGIPTEMDILFDVIKEYESASNDNVLLDTDEEWCEIWAEEHYEDIKQLYLDKANNYIMDAAHGDLFAQEQEEDTVVTARFYKNRFKVAISPTVVKELKIDAEDDISDIESDPRGAAILTYYIERLIEDSGYEPTPSEQNFLKKFKEVKAQRKSKSTQETGYNNPFLWD